MIAAVPRKEVLERTVEGFRGFTFVISGAKEMGIISGTVFGNIKTSIPKAETTTINLISFVIITVYLTFCRG